jgi:hypothetical protein
MLDKYFNVMEPNYGPALVTLMEAAHKWGKPWLRVLLGPDMGVRQNGDVSAGNPDFIAKGTSS